MEYLDSWTIEVYLDSVWTDISAYVLNNVSDINRKWGMSSNAAEDRLAKTGTLTFSLNNADKRFSPLAETALTGWKKGVLVKLTLTYSSTPYVKFFGFVDKIEIDSGTVNSDRRVKVTALDWMDYAAKYPIQSPAIQQDITATTAIQSILAGMPIQPQGTVLATGNSTFPIVFDSATVRTKAYTEFQKLASSEPGYIYPTSSGTLVFENSTQRGTDRTVKQIEGNDVQFDNCFLSTDITYGDNIVNHFQAAAYPKAIDDKVKKIYELESPLYVESGKQKTFEIQYTDPTSKRVMSALTPPSQGTTKSLLHMDGVPYSEFIDEMGHTWTPVGVSKYQTDKKFGTGSAYFDGSNAWMYTPDKADWDLGTSDFWISMWVKILDETTGRTLMARDYNTSYSPFLFGYSDGTNLDIYITSNGSSWDIANAKTFGAINFDWQHLALGRSGDTFYAFRDGALIDTWTSSAAIASSTQVLSLGRYLTSYADALIDELQFVKGACLYTSTFTPPAAALEAEGQYWAAWTNADKTGTELTDSFTVTAVFGGAGALMTVTNTSANNGYLTTLKIFAYGVHNDSPITYISENEASYEEYGYQNESLDMQYQSDIDEGKTEADKVVLYEKQPRMMVNNIFMNANKSADLMKAFLQCEIGDLVYIKEDQTGFEGNAYIQGGEFSISAGKNINYGYIVKQDFTANVSQYNLSLIGCEFHGEVDTSEAIDFGYLSSVSGISNRGFSMWVYVYNYDSLVSVVLSTAELDNANGVWIGVNAIDGINKETSFFIRNNFSVAGGIWYSSDISTSQWVHLFISYDNSSASNNPSVYINGASDTITTYTSPSGDIIAETGKLMLGNNEDGALAFGGIIKDVRVYNMTTYGGSASVLASALYSAGAGGSGNATGLVFKAFGVPTYDYDYYVDKVLTTEVLYDTVGHNMGTAIGSPKTTNTITAYTVDLTLDDTTIISSPYNALNYNTDTNILIGNLDSITRRAIIKPDYTDIPTGATPTGGTITLTNIVQYGTISRTMYAYRILQAVNMGTATWDTYSSGNNWGSAGCSDAVNDYYGTTILGTATVSYPLTGYQIINVPILTEAIINYNDLTWDNNGIILFNDTEFDDLVTWGAVEHATAAYRPTFTIAYHF